MRLNSRIPVLFGLFVPGFAFPGPRDPSTNSGRAWAVKAAFKTAWEGYYEHAFPHDSLLPISNSFEDDRNAWGVTVIDSLSTAIVMGEAEIVDQMLEYIPTIDFSTTEKPDETVSLFESTIRYLGGLVSAYDLLKGPYKSLASDSKKVDALLEQAISIADSLSIAFTTGSGVPDGDVILNPEPRRSGNNINGPAGFGTLVLEWTRLSDLSGDQKYAQLAQKAEQYLLRPSGVPEAFPGLVGSSVDTETGKFTDSSGGWGGGSDSYYEYLIKMYLYDPSAFGEYKDRWVEAADSTMKYLASHPTSREELTFLSGYDGPNKTHASSSHLASFAGGNFIFGGILLKEDKYIDFGIKLAESYYETYRGTDSGIGPGGFAWVDNARLGGAAPPADQADLYDETGFWVTSGDYLLRPETMESLYYAYRATGEPKYQDLAWEGFQHMLKLCRVGSGFSGLNNVSDALGGGYDDFQESFWLAETLKYLYLIFAPESPVQVQVNGPNEFVFNTEAHPVRVRQ